MKIIAGLGFDLGLSPAQRVIEEGDQQALLNEALDLSLQSDETAWLNAIGRRLGTADWQAEVLGLVEKARANLPFNRHLKNGQLQSGRIDLALEFNDGWVVIDHKSNPRPKGEWFGIFAQHSDQLAAYSAALETLTRWVEQAG